MKANVEKLLFILVIVLVLTLCTAGCSSGNDVPTVVVPAATPVPVTVRPATHSECVNGGTVVSIGTSDNIICNGASGKDGKDGLDGTQIVIVQFCPGTPTCPNQFPEIGLLIGTSVYGVYSQNGGFLAYLPPGTYYSNGINNSCTFTINTDGSISH